MSRVSIDRPGGRALLRKHILDQLDSAGESGLDAGDLRAPESVEAGDTEIAAGLRDLEREGLAVEWSRRWFHLRSTDFVTGRIKRLEGGDALLLTGAGGEAGYFVPRARAKGSMDGDLALVRPQKQPRGRRRAGERLPEASVVKILDRRYDTVVGTVEIDDDDRRWLIPFDTKADFDLEIVGGHEEVLEDHYVVVEVEPPTTGTGRPRGRIVEVLGDPSVPGVDTEVVLRHYKIPDRFPEEVSAAAEELPEDPGPADWEGREDLRDRILVTIDGESARDFDDAVSVERLEGRGRAAFRLGVHIADVSHYVRPGSVLDKEAYHRGTSVYYPERAVPMLPERVSNGLCSLRPHVPRLAKSVFLDFDPDGEVVERRFAETVIESKRRMTYEEVRRLLEEPADGDAAEYAGVLDMLRQAEELMRVLLARRNGRGSIDFDLPEGDVILDTDGHTVGIKPGERNVAHRIIEELMIAANEAVAFQLVTHELPALYRVHDAPTQEDLVGLEETLGAIGVKLRGDLSALHPSALQDVLAQVEGTEEEPFVSTLVLRTMQRALYQEECRGHYALASRYYAHFTSPIRRYPDLVAHRALEALLGGREKSDPEEVALAERMPGVGEHCSQTERRAERSERELLQWKKVRFLARRVGETFNGRITGVQPFGMFVQLDDLYVDGLVPVRALEDDYYVFEPAAHRLVGADHGKVFQLADRIEVRLTGVSQRHRGLDLVPVSLDQRRDEPRRGERRAQTRERGRRRRRRR